jgi:hypothetical protein
MRRVFSVDLEAMSSDVVTWASQSNRDYGPISQQTAVEIGQRVTSIAPPSGVANDAIQIDLLKKLSGTIADQAKNKSVPNVSADRIKEKMIGGGQHSQVQLDSLLTGNKEVKNVETSTIDDTSAASVLNSNFVQTIIPFARANTSRTKTQSVSESTTITTIGGYCTPDGALVSPSPSILKSPIGMDGAEGEGDEPNDILPELVFPDLETWAHQGAFDNFIMEQATSGVFITTFGSFTAQSLVNPDFSLPGVHWVWARNQVWVSENEWSFTEQLVYSFRLENSQSETGDSILTYADDNGDEEDGDDDGNSLSEIFDETASVSSTTNAERFGYVIYTFSGSKGIASPASSGLSWLMNVSYSDTINLGSVWTGTGTYTPKPTSEGGSGGGSSGGSGEEDNNSEDNSLPEDFNGQINLNSTANISFTTTGTNTVSSSPQIVAGEVERSVAATVSNSFTGSISNNVGWVNGSLSGALVLESIANVPPGQNPLLLVSDEVFESSLIQEDSEGSEALDYEAITEDWDSENAPDTPLGPISGIGHASLDQGSHTRQGSTGVNMGMDIQGILKGGKFKNLLGDISSQIQAHSGNGGDVTDFFVYRNEDHQETETSEVNTSVVYVEGWSSDGNASSILQSTTGALPEVTTEGDLQINVDLQGVADGESGSQGTQFTWLIARGNGHTLISQEGNYGPNSNTNSESEDKWLAVYASNIKGNSVGDVLGEINGSTISTELSNDLTGKGVDLLFVRSSGWSTYDHFEESEYRTEPDYLNSVHANRELFVSRFEIDGPVEITSTSNAELEIKPTVTGRVVDQIAYENTEFGNGGFQIGDWFWEHSWDRLATFNTNRHSEFNINGDVEVLPDGTTTLGQSSITGSEWYNGDAEVSISGYDYHGPFTEKTEYEIDLERLMGLAPPAGEGDGGSSGDSSGGSSGGGQSGGGTLPPPVQDESFTWAVTKGFFMGLAQGGVNLVNGVQDAAIGVANTPALLANSVAGGIDYVSGNTDEHNQIRIPYIPSPDWSRDLIVHEGGTPGGWDDMHGWSKFAAGEGAVGLITGGMSKAASAVDDAGNCANWFAKFVNGGCFVAGTPVLLTAMPMNYIIQNQLWGDTSSWFLNNENTEDESGNLKTKTQLLIPIQEVPLGARVPTKNPRPWEVDGVPEPDTDSWVKISLIINRNDGGFVEIEMLRSVAWIQANSISPGRFVPFNLPELQVSGHAFVTALDECPPIASGVGSVVTARFITREVQVVASAEVCSHDGRRETITGTTVHPIWSVDRQDWVPLGELAEGETLRGVEGDVVVLSIAFLRVAQEVYNLEVHNEHVYQVGELGVLVHNTGPCLVRFGQKAESAVQLAEDAARAMANGFPHGVSTKLVTRVSGSDKLHKFASLEDVKAVFKVEQTGNRLTHYTVHLPHPVTDEVAELFNFIFKPKG